MPVDPDISQSTAGGGYQPGLDPDYDPDQVSSRPNVDSVSKPKRPREKEEPFNIRTAIPTALPKISEGGTSDDAYRAEMHKESLDADRKAEGKKQASKKLAAKDSSGQGGQSQGSDGEQGAQGQPGQYKSPYKFPTVSGGASGGGGKTGLPGGAGAVGAKGVGSGKAAAAEAAVQGLQKGLQKAQQGDIKGGAEDAVIGAAEGVGDQLMSRAFLYLASPPAIAATFTLSILIGWNLLLFTPKLLKAILKIFTKKEIDIKLETWQRYVIIAMDTIIAFIIFLCLVVSAAAFCYSLTSPTLKDRLYAFAASPAGASAGELGRFFMPQSVVNFCEGLTGNATSGIGTASGSISGPGINSGRCKVQTSGYCSPESLQSHGCPADKARGMSIVCGMESVSDPTIGSQTDVCYDSSGPRTFKYSNNPSLPNSIRGKTAPLSVSWGLLQLNLTYHTPEGLNCPAAFNGRYSGKGSQCSVKDPGLYEKCIVAATNIDSNLNYSCKLVRENGYRDWTCSAWRCGVSPIASNCNSKWGIKLDTPYPNPELNP
ncbi:MAG: hypothetical protein IT410_04645 [Candidatus Doudnabacteria bacterium]|nr:hypothetical protein [Candidatus Doudnabacteria bacterium]